MIHPLPLCRLAVLCGCLLLASGCALRQATVPMAAQTDRSACPATTDTLIVMLPGAYSEPEEFEREGFVTAVRARHLAVDVELADAHLGYYNNASIVDRLDADVIAPAKARGYRAIWIVGISIGGFGGLVYEQDRPGQLAGLVVLAPYLGARWMSTDVENAGGLAAWRGPLSPVLKQTRSGRELKLWQWLKGYATVPTVEGRAPLYLGYGSGDRFAFSHELLAAALPKERVFTTPGGHDWPEWNRLWTAILPTLPLPACKS